MSDITLDGMVTFVYSTNLTASANFYESALGLSLALDQGSCKIYKIIDGAYLGVCQCKAPQDFKGPSDDVILTIVTQEVDQMHARLVMANAHIEDEPQLNPQFGIYHFFARDPTGWRIEVQRFVSPDLPGVRATPK